MDYKGQRVVLVTGAGGGIGNAICRRIAAPGTAILLHGRKGGSGDAALEKAARELRKAGAEVDVISCDLEQDGAGAMLVEKAANRFGRLDQLVSNAGYADDRLFGAANREDLDKAYRVMTAAFFDIVNTSVTHLRRSSRGRVIAVSSFTAHQFRAGALYPVTAAAKSAMETLAFSLAAQLAPDQVTVNCVVPGYTRKDHGRDPAFWDRAAESTPMKQIADPEDVAALVAFLLSDDARLITGQSIAVDGGLGLGVARF